MKLEEWRNEIDSIDAEIVSLINQRARIAKKIGTLKAKAGLPIIDPDREEQILKNACSKNQGALTDRSIVGIYRKIIRESKQIQVGVAGKISEKGVEI